LALCRAKRGRPSRARKRRHRRRSQRGYGNFDHIAFLASDYDATCRHLDALGVEFRNNDVPRARLRQLFLTDPNRVMIELNFPMDA